MIRKTKILIFSHYAGLYGASRSLLDLLSVIIQEPGLELMVFIPYYGPLTNAFINLNIPYKIVAYPNNVIFGGIKEDLTLINKTKRNIRRIRKYLPVLKKVYKEGKLFNPDLVYTNSAVIYWGAFFSMLTQTKHIWHLRELKDAYNLKHNFGLIFFRKLLDKSEKIICNSKAVAKNYKVDKLKKTEVIYNGLYTLEEAINFFQKRKLKHSNSFTFGIVGGVHPTKGQLTGLEALSNWKKKSLADFKIFIVGLAEDEAYNKLIEIFINENNLSANVVFTGHSDFVEEYYVKMDVLICPSLSEAFGRVIIEAMVRGIIVIARNTGGIPEIIEHTKNGFLYNNNEELVDCIALLAGNECGLEVIREAAFEKVKKDFLKETYSRQILQVFNSLL